jgi:hypothetical protein
MSDDVVLPEVQIRGEPGAAHQGQRARIGDQQVHDPSNPGRSRGALAAAVVE